MQVSERIATLNDGGDDGWNVFYRAREMVAAGEQVVQLTIGEPDTKTDPGILDAMDASARSGHTGYATISGIAAFRDKVAEVTTAETGIKTTCENVAIVPGAQAGLFAAHLAVCDPGDTALFCEPYYVTYPGTIRAASAIPRAIQTASDRGFQPTRDDIVSQVKGARSLLINTPNNPTGAVYSEKTMQGIAEVVTEHDLWLISDEVYGTQVWDGTHISARAMPEMSDRTIVVGSMSKSHAMTGSRIGWLIGPENVIAELINLANYTTYGVPGYIQDAALFALGEGPSLSEKVAAPFKRRREAACDLLNKQNTVRYLPASGGMYVMLDIRATGLTGEEFANRLLDECKIAVMPGESFGQSAAGHVRVAMTVADEEFEAALAKLLEFANLHV